ncbi:MAG: DNA primase [Mariniphaga sp.]
MIDQITIQQILDAAEIADVVGEFVTLKRRGTSLIGLCPFHNEKTPSFNVSQAKGIYKCFGCSKGGSSVNFIMEHEHLSYTDALRWLAKKYNIDIREKEESPENLKERNDRESQLIVSEFAQKFFTEQLWDTNTGRLVGLSYLRQRGMRDDIIKKFGIGYCPDGKDLMTNAALKEGFRMEFLEKTGLTIKREDWIRDRFAGRVMFPIHGISGRVIGFGGRTLAQDKTIAKYLNSPESDIYHKSRVLYGIFQAKRSIIQQDKCYLVEGYTDVTSLHQSGIENVVASSGTSLTIDQIRLIRRFTNNVTIIYDGDQAGIKASMRGIDMVLEEGINVKVLPLPEGEDPDSFSRSMGATQLAQYIKDNETDFINFKTKLLLVGVEKDPVSRAKLITDIVSSISVIPHEIVRSEYLKECSRLLDVREEILYNEIRKLKTKTEDEMIKHQERELLREANVKSQPVLLPVPENNPCETEEIELLKLLIKYGLHKIFEVENPETGDVEAINVAGYVLSELDADQMESVNPVIKAVFDEYALHFEEPNFDAIKYFVNHPQNQISQLVSDILSEKNKLSEFWRKRGSFIEEEHEILFQLVPKVLQEYKLRYITFLISQAEQGIRKASEQNDFEAIMEYQKKYQKLKAVEKLLCGHLGKRTITG